MVLVRDARIDDLPELLAVYNQAVENTPATFDLEPQTLEQRREWFDQHSREYPLLVAEADGRVLGYACLSRYRAKPACGKTVESPVYIAAEHQRQGVGTTLMNALLQCPADLGYHCVLAGVVCGNSGSARLHEWLGFEHVGCLREVGYKFGTWHDVHWYELFLH